MASGSAPSVSLRQAMRRLHLSKQSLHTTQLSRRASTSAQPVNDYAEVEPLPASPKPPSREWYTGRPALNSFLVTLQDTLKTSRSTLYRQGYLSSVSQDVRTLPAATLQQQQAQRQGQRWLSADSMASKIGLSKVRLASYRQITGLLGELQALLPYLRQEGLGENVETLLKNYSRPSSSNPAAALALDNASALGSLQTRDIGGRENNRGYGYVSRETGISYGEGKKKTAVARAWVLPLPETWKSKAKSVSAEVPDTVDSASATAEAAPTDNAEPATPVSGPTLGRILVNSRSIAEYFAEASERSVLLRPFSITETIGQYNVFILVRGGGISSQAQAAAVACSRALAAMDLSEAQERKAILRKADLLRRDPRVVERKKTGRPKARKGYTWVKR